MDKSSDSLHGAASGAVPGRAGFDTLIVGAGFAGSVMAERLANELGQRVLIVDKRPHIGGNAYDRYDDAGVLIHPYGPHIFHTNAADIFEYLSRFTEWRPYQHRVLASVDGQEVPMPINLDTVNMLYGLKLTSFEMQGWFDSVAEKKDALLTSEDAVVSKVGRELYNKFFRGYTESSGASTRRNSTPASPRVCRPAPTATTATSPTPSRRFRSTATPACSRRCSRIRTSR